MGPYARELEQDGDQGGMDQEKDDNDDGNSYQSASVSEYSEDGMEEDYYE